MRSFLVFIMAFLVGISPSLSQKPQTDNAKALLWEITPKDGGASSWLFGTIHLISESEFEVPDTLLDRLKQTNHLVLELDMDEAMNPMAQMALLPRMIMPDGLKLVDLLEKEDYDRVMIALENTGLPGFMAESIKPLFLSALIDPSMGMSGGMASYDMYLYTFAKENNMAHGGLETVEEQLSAFDEIPLKVQAEMLAEQLLEDNKQKVDLDGLVKAYKEEDLSKLQSLMDEQNGLAPNMMESLLYKRNRLWISRMEEMMKEGPIFFAVGAGHLSGEEGVVHLLQQAGYNLKPYSVFK